MNSDTNNFTVDEVLNALDSLETAASFHGRPDALKWKWIAIALDHAFDGFCVAAVAMHEPISVLKGINDDGHMFERPGQGWVRSKTVKIKGTSAYRIEWEPCDSPPEPQDNAAPLEDRLGQHLKGKTIGFWTALARVQDQVFWMARMSNTRALILSDDQMERIRRMHEWVRNELVHFLPGNKTLSVKDIQEVSKDVINAIEFLVFKSFAIRSIRCDVRDRTKNAIIKFANYYHDDLI